MRGYLDDEQTAKAIDGDGWFITGDIGVMDATGNVRIVDRRADMFHVGGFNVYPAEVEAFLLRNDDIDAVAVVGVPDDKLGNVGAAFVIAHPGSAVTATSIVEWSRGRMANYKVPRHVMFVDRLPLNATGKVDKAKLRERAGAATIGV
jgi:acyl-CoA synthetase (AMP-forming)/AMP-acid ligase II